MTGQEAPAVELRPWSNDDLPLLVRLMGDPAMTEHLGGPENDEKIRWRHRRPTVERDLPEARLLADRGAGL